MRLIFRETRGVNMYEVKYLRNMAGVTRRDRVKN